MPIKSLSETVRLPRLGKFHLGIKVKNDKGVEYPQKTDYFVMPKDHPAYPALVKIFGDKPKSLRILIPSEETEEWASQWYKWYDVTHGLICKGNGETAVRLIDIKTNQVPTKEATEKGAKTELREIICAGPECPDYGKRGCGETMNLRFVLPELPGLGIWQIDTGSKNSIININSCARLIKLAFGRISNIPLSLTLEPIEVNNPETGKKQTVFVMNLRAAVTLAELAEAAREQDNRFRLAMPNVLVEYEDGKRDIAELWEDGGTSEQKQITEVTPEKPPSPPVEAKAEKAPERQEATRYDLAAIKEILRVIKWTDGTVKSWLVVLAGRKVQTKANLEDMLDALSDEQLHKFTEHIRLMREAAGEYPPLNEVKDGKMTKEKI